MHNKYKGKFFEGAEHGKEFKPLIPKYFPLKYKESLLEETKLLKKYLKGADRILEAGVGTGRLIPVLSPLVKEVVGVDNANLMIKGAKAVAKNFLNTKIIRADLKSLSKVFPENYFDYSLCVWNTLGNTKNEVKVLGQLNKTTSKAIFVTVCRKGTVKDKVNLWKAVGIKIKKIDKKNEILYSESGLKSYSYSLEDLKNLGGKAGLKIKKSKVLNKVMLWVEFVRA